MSIHRHMLGRISAISSCTLLIFSFSAPVAAVEEACIALNSIDKDGTEHLVLANTCSKGQMIAIWFDDEKFDEFCASPDEPFEFERLEGENLIDVIGEC